MTDKTARYEVVAEPYYTADGLRYASPEDFAAGVVIGDVLVISEAAYADLTDNPFEPDEEGDLLGTIERTGAEEAIALAVLKRLES